MGDDRLVGAGGDWRKHSVSLRNGFCELLAWTLSGRTLSSSHLHRKSSQCPTQPCYHNVMLYEQRLPLSAGAPRFLCPLPCWMPSCPDAGWSSLHSGRGRCCCCHCWPQAAEPPSSAPLRSAAGPLFLVSPQAAMDTEL